MNRLTAISATLALSAALASHTATANEDYFKDSRYYNAPAITTNFNTLDGKKVGFAKVEYFVAGHSKKDMKKISTYLPEIRGMVVSAIYSAEKNKIATLEGRDQLASQLKLAIDDLIQRETGEQLLEDFAFKFFLHT